METPKNKLEVGAEFHRRLGEILNGYRQAIDAAFALQQYKRTELHEWFNKAYGEAPEPESTDDTK